MSLITRFSFNIFIEEKQSLESIGNGYFSQHDPFNKC